MGDKSTTVVLFFQGEQLDFSAAKLRVHPFSGHSLIL